MEENKERIMMQRNEGRKGGKLRRHSTQKTWKEVNLLDFTT